MPQPSPDLFGRRMFLYPFGFVFALCLVFLYWFYSVWLRVDLRKVAGFWPDVKTLPVRGTFVWLLFWLVIWLGFDVFCFLFGCLFSFLRCFFRRADGKPISYLSATSAEDPRRCCNVMIFLHLTRFSKHVAFFMYFSWFFFGRLVGKLIGFLVPSYKRGGEHVNNRY